MVYSSSGSGDDRRQHKRFLVHGVASLETDTGTIQAELLNVGAGGLLILSSSALPHGTPVNVRFIVKDYPIEVAVNGTVVHSTESTIGVMFGDEPEGLDEILLWLEAGFLAAMLA
jgi:hypothetical protein